MERSTASPGVVRGSRIGWGQGTKAGSGVNKAGDGGAGVEPWEAPQRLHLKDPVCVLAVSLPAGSSFTPTLLPSSSQAACVPELPQMSTHALFLTVVLPH